MINIITINLNNAEGLKKTIKSVIKQTFLDKINYIIIDGGSTDGSLDVIENYKEYFYYWVSEKDGGIFNAMNKGIDAAPNEGYCLFMNSGDYLHDNDIIRNIYKELDGTSIVYGNEYFLEKERKRLSTYPDKLDEAFFRRTALPHQSTFISAKLMKENKYCEDCGLLGDWKFLRESIIDKNVSYKHIPLTISVYGLDGISTINRKVFEREKLEYYRNK